MGNIMSLKCILTLRLFSRSSFTERNSSLFFEFSNSKTDLIYLHLYTISMGVENRWANLSDSPIIILTLWVFIYLLSNRIDKKPQHTQAILYLLPSYNSNRKVWFSATRFWFYFKDYLTRPTASLNGCLLWCSCVKNYRPYATNRSHLHDYAIISSLFHIFVPSACEFHFYTFCWRFTVGKIFIPIICTVHTCYFNVLWVTCICKYVST